MGVTDGASNIEKGSSSSHVPWWRQRCVLILAMCLAAMVIVMIIVITTLTPDCAREPASETTSTPLSTYAEVAMQTPVEPEFRLADGRSVARRSEWTEMPPAYRRPLHHPTPYVVVAHTAGPACEHVAHCFSLLRSYHDEHRARWMQPDITYNFLIDVTGNVYEGRGWDTTNNYGSWARRCNLGVALLGNFMSDNATAAMMLSLRQLLDLGVVLGKLHPEYRLVAQNQLIATLSPGVNVLQAISTWPHRCLHHCDAGVHCVDEDTDQLGT